MDLPALKRSLSHHIHLTRPLEYCLIRKWVKIRDRDVILDIGCGDGFWSKQFHKKNRKVFGLDYDIDILAWAKAHHGAVVQYLNASGQDISLADACVDVLVSVCALQHFPDHLRALKEFNRVLRPGGRLGMSLDSLCLPGISDEYRRLHAQRYSIQNLYSRQSISDLLARTGFRMTHATYLATSPFAGRIIQMQVERGWNINYLAPFSNALLNIADRVSPGKEQGYILVVAAEKA